MFKMQSLLWGTAVSLTVCCFTGGALAEGFQTRLQEFQHFEQIFEVFMMGFLDCLIFIAKVAFSLMLSLILLSITHISKWRSVRYLNHLHLCLFCGFCSYLLTLSSRLLERNIIQWGKGPKLLAHVLRCQYQHSLCKRKLWSWNVCITYSHVLVNVCSKKFSFINVNLKIYFHF